MGKLHIKSRQHLICDQMTTSQCKILGASLNSIIFLKKPLRHLASLNIVTLAKYSQPQEDGHLGRNFMPTIALTVTIGMVVSST